MEAEKESCTIFSRAGLRVEMIHKDLDKKDRKSEQYVNDRADISGHLKSTISKVEEITKNNQTLLSQLNSERDRLIESGTLGKDESTSTLNLTGDNKVGTSSSRGESSKAGGSLLDDYADTSCEFPDYTGGGAMIKLFSGIGLFCSID